ncbi:RecX family transcriptional regulator [Erythrobacter sp. SDW2]|uniref:regulatory protein RecX n=1 Tax=Erythrobacter sp. SDW2 TaxID=2907154 RepID=UPI001F1B8AC0|nr:RecX family transcriptional regulator [Erythrobacter sp. SDW2]UIP07660.1 RecX family transcriptional regulator [Erythrobacter sp. SDW2]
MQAKRPSRPRAKRPTKPLDETRLRDLALAYVARFATSGGKLEAYLKRKLRERGWEGEAEPDVAALVTRYTELGYVDDAAYARAKSGDLLRRGYGPRRVSQALGQAGIGEDLRASVAASAHEARAAALQLARKRRFGPFAGEPADRALREKQLAAMIRAGHGFDIARAVLEAASEDEAEAWVSEAIE